MKLTKASDSRAKRFSYAESVELDAIHPDMLRELVERTVERHLPARQYEVLLAAEESEREFLRQWTATVAGAVESS